VARDRKRAKQRRDRRAQKARSSTPASTPARVDVPGALDHASADVDEFDAALLAGAGGVPAKPGPLVDGEVADPASVPDVKDDPLHLDEHEVEAEALAEGDIGADELEEPGDDVKRRAPGGGGGPGGGVTAEQASGAPIRGSGGNRVLAFFRASWAELQRVQWPDRRHVTQATAVVLGFVAIAGAYLGLADFVAKEIVEFIL
jgi:preprotein translocase subunit SecE